MSISMSQSSIRARLSWVMFIQYFIWACWYVSMGTYLVNTLHFDGAQVGLAYGAFAIAAMISPFITGLIADRWFATEHIIGVLGLLGGLVMLVIPQLRNFGAFYPVLILYCILYVPTLACGNALALHHLENARRDFPRVKLFSAVGFIAGLVVLNLVDGAESSIQFYLAGSGSLLLGIMAFFLPHTPPPKKGGDVRLGEVLGLDALALLKRPSFAVFIIAMFFLCIPLYFYFVNLGIYLTELKWENMLVKTSLAQLSDVVFFLLLPWFLQRLGYKKTILLGTACWVVRYFLLAGSVSAGTSQAALIFAAILLHGACYDFLFIAGQLYVDETAGARMRGAAQGLIAFVTWGAGSFVGTLLAGEVLQRKALSPPAVGLLHEWQLIWQVPAWCAVGVWIFFAAFFRESHALPVVVEDA
ncbi:MFS transporter [Prosthecobacter sp.]|uniref:MFS transporter n=1 Tax=Prosthecobacter sp. TaxID=1965333 RepID=UPI0037836A22